MRIRRQVLLVAAVLAGGAGCGEETGPVEVPPELARQAPPPEAFVKPLGAAVRLDVARDDDAYLRAFTTTFSSLTPENEMKWSFIHPSEDEYDFEAADALVDLAAKTRKRVRGHTLVWDEQLPDWVADEDWRAAELAAVLRDHVRTVVGHFKGRVAEWDVVNEPLNGDGSLTQSIWGRALGPRYLAIAFRAARAADPGARLFLNEIGAELPGPKRDALLRLAGDLRRNGVPIDGVGFQDHTTLAGALPRQPLLDLFASVGALGLDVAITEMDVTIPRSDGGADALQRQAVAYSESARACAKAPNCTGFTVWGVTDEYSWRGAALRPLVFDANASPKPALDAVNRILRPQG